MNFGIDDAIENLRRKASELPSEEIPAVLSSLGGLVVMLSSRFPKEIHIKDESQVDTFISVEDAAKIANLTPSWIKKNHKSLPFVRRLSRKKWLVDKARFFKWLAAKRA